MSNLYLFSHQAFLCLDMAYSKEVDGIQPRPLSEVVIEKLTCATDNPPKKRKKVSGVSQELYKPFNESLAELNIPAALGCPEPGFLRIWPE